MTTRLATSLLFVLALTGCCTQTVTSGRKSVSEPPRDAGAAAQDTAPRAAPANVTGAVVTQKTVMWAVDAAPAAAASKTMPMGSIIVAASTSSDPSSEDSEVSVFEWDVAGERVIRTTTLPRSAGEPVRAVRVARTTDRVYVAVEADAPSHAVRLFALRHDLSVVETKPMGDGEGVSLEASDRYVAFSKVRGYPDTRLTVTLLEPTKLREIAHREVGGLVVDATLKTDHLELGRDRLFVLGTAPRPGGPRRSAETGALSEPVTMFALALPSLDVRGTYVTNRSGQLGASLIGDPRSGHVHLSTDELLELDRNAVLVRTRNVPASSIPTFSASGDLFDGGDEPARAALFAGGDGSQELPHCAGLWSGQTRLLLCGLGAGGLRVVRVAKDWPPRPALGE